MQDSFKVILSLPVYSNRVDHLLEDKPVLFVVDVEPANPNFVSPYKNRVEWLAHIKGTTAQQKGQFFTNLGTKGEIADYLKTRMVVTGEYLREIAM